ncbi:Ig-like domain-containing protein [Chroococcus sp. FPU101]|uniref:Ig-like domain-containing protein n=1 Tax=Chroococcus sp. FPU101 TaxID=1974212 RepID=UPI001A901459|nr:Ig-like domain-containing protein [Chroococcus sp. FPU101]GFE67447.1 hypothetical protein CFPU101_00570 [Chroococcus sp. FPU101]
MAPVVSFSANPSVLVESESTVLVLTFNLSEPPPSGGVTVRLTTDVRESLNQISVFDITVTGGEFPMPDIDNTGVEFTITSQTATISSPIFQDDEAEDPLTVTYTLLPGEGYTINPSASQDSVVFRDDPEPIAENAPPVANDDSGTILENQVLTGNVIANDSDPNNDPITVTALNGNTSIGTLVIDSGALVTLNADGSYSYNPNGQFNYLVDGQSTGDSFSYTISDGRGGTDTATVALTINGVSDVVPPPPPVELDPAQYGASYVDLITNIGYNLEALTNHYLTNGQAEGRSKDLFDEFRYIASSYVTGDDLIVAFGLNGAVATQHYITNGYAEGRSTTAFIPSRYLASYDDLLGVFGTDTQAATAHFITNGALENRDPNLFPSDRYLASNGDLINAFASIPDYAAKIETASNHYLFNGRGEGRQITFDPNTYLNANQDLIPFVQAGLDPTQHYILSGFAEGRPTV